MKILIVILALMISISGYSKTGMVRHNIDSLKEIIENVISKDWFVIKMSDGFEIIYCRTCQLEYEDSLSKSGVRGLILKRNDFYKTHGPDSVNYYSTVNNVLNNTETDLLKMYPMNGVLRFSVKFEDPWSIDRLQKAQDFNNNLKSIVLAQSISKLNNEMFLDFRFWIPEPLYWKNKIADSNSNFIKLPYFSHWLNYSIFITQDKPFFFAGIGFIEKNTFVSLEKKRRKALMQISYALGISDYKILN
jgi:hypothetical protein